MALYLTLILIILSVFLYVYWFLKKIYSFFQENRIPYLKPNFIFGNVTDAILLRKSLAEVYLDVYRKLEPHKFGGVFIMQKRTVMIRDPELLRDVLIKDFNYFYDRGINVNVETEPLPYNLFTMKGGEWKNLRIKLTRTFTTGKMKMLFPLVKDCGEKLNNIIEQTPSIEAFDIKDLSARYTTDVIGTCAFGLETGALDNPNSEFRQMGKRVFKFRYQTLIRSLWPNISTKLVKLFKIHFLEEEITNFFLDIVDKTIKYREKNNITRYDILHLLIDLKNNSGTEKFHNSGETEDLEKFLAQVGKESVSSDIKIDNKLLAGQCFVFFLAGFETSSTTLGYCMLELAQNQQIQNKVREEIKTVLEKNQGNLTYEVLKQMTYTDMVIAETLRKHPVLTFLLRECSQTYKIPGTDAIIPEKTSILIPVYGIHLDSKYYDNPEEFRPERFTEEEKAKRPKYTYLPFGDGPRSCIGKRFGKMQVKIGLIFMLKDFSYHLSPKTKFPLELEKNFGFLTIKSGIWLHRQKI